MSKQSKAKRRYELLRNVLKMECLQPADGWTEDACAEWGCKFLHNDECSMLEAIEVEIMRLKQETGELPF